MTAEEIESELKANPEWKYHRGPSVPKYNDGLYQRRYRLPNGKTRFFINLYRYPARPECDLALAFMADAQLYPSDSDVTFVELQISSPQSVTQIEGYVAAVWDALKCVPDRHNND